MLKSALALLLLLAGFGALVAFLSPFHNTPVQDDWDYARTVRLLLQTGTFQRSEIAQATEISSALWGAAFAAVLGFSFDALRISTLVLSAVSLVLFFALLGELGFNVTQRTLGAAVLLVSPLFLFLSFSFMTDIPALACLLAAIFCYVRALRQGELRWALAGSVCATLGFLTRQLGLVSALAAAAYFVVRPPAARAPRAASRRAMRGEVLPAEGSPVPATRLDSIVKRRRAMRAGVRPDDDAPSFFSRLAGVGRRRPARLRSDDPAQPTLQRRAFTPPLRPLDERPPSLGRRLAWVIASAALPVSAALLYALWLSLVGGVTWANSQLTLGGTLDFVRDPQTPATLLRRIVEDSMTLAVYVLPLWLLVGSAWRGVRETSAYLLPPPRSRVSRALAILVRLIRWVAALAVAAIFAVSVFRLAQRGEYLPYLTDVVTRQGLRPYLAYFAYAGGSFRPDILPLPFWGALTLVGCVGGWALALLVLSRFRRPALRPESGAGFVYWSALCLAVPTLAFPEFYERFLLPFLPVTIILLLDISRSRGGTSNRSRAALLAAAGVLLVAGCSLALLRDYWAWMDVRWPLAESLVAMGVPLEKLDGGYEWDGWNLYDQSMALIRQRQLPMQITPWAYAIDPQVMLAFSPLAGYHVARVVQFDSPFGPNAGRFYVLEKGN